jgi:hypothetical protein
MIGVGLLVPLDLRKVVRMFSLRTRSLTVIVLFLTVAPAPAQTTLRFKHKAGDKTAYTTTQQNTIKLDILGQETTVESTVTLDWTLHVLEVADGRATVAYKMDRIRLTTTDGATGNKQTTDSDDPKTITKDSDKKVFAALKKDGIRATLDERGLIKVLKVPDEILEEFKAAGAPADALADVARQLFEPMCLTLPADAVAKGQGWRGGQIETPQIGGKVKQEQACTYQGTVKRDGKALEQIDLKPTVTVVTDPKSKATTKGKGDGTGTLLFDNTAGRVVEATQTVNLTLEVDGGAGAMTAMKSKQTTTLKLRQ